MSSFQIVINGDPREVSTGWSLLDLLAALDFDPRTVAVERNGEIVPRNLHGQTLLHEADRLEIVRFVQGG